MILLDEEALIACYPTSAITYDNAAFFEGLTRRQLLAPRCRSCSRWHLPPQPVCPACWSADLVHLPLGGEGVIHMFTVLSTGADLQVLVTVQLDEQEDLRFSGELVDVEQGALLIGRRVHLNWRPARTSSQPVFVLAETER